MASRRVLFVLTNHADLGDTGKKTGWYLPEVAHPYFVITKAGFDVVFGSPNGGASPVDPGSVEMFKDDEMCKAFMENPELMAATGATAKIADLDMSTFSAVFFAGGHGPMWDLPTNEEVGAKAAEVYKAGGVLGAVCHGTVGLLPVKDAETGELIIKGKRVTSFTNAEEAAISLTEVVPFPLETKLGEAGAEFVGAENWANHVVVDGTIITGQNPASATAVGEAIVAALSGGK